MTLFATLPPVAELVQPVCSIARWTAERMLYWVDGKMGRVERCQLDGSGRLLLYSRPGHHYRGVALSPRFIYVTDQTNRYATAQRRRRLRKSYGRGEAGS